MDTATVLIGCAEVAITLAGFTSITTIIVEQSEISLDKIKITSSSEDARTELGLKEIEKQIRKAAEQVCGEKEPRRVGSLTQMAENRRCYARAIQSGMQALDRVA
jgi:UrcA family protein